MKVFISSVTYLLKEERAALPPFLRLFDYDPLRFEDFEAQDRSSREACLAGVEAADVYLLLLGPRYGTPFQDTGLSPTAEEFRRARQRGIPILVFNKIVDEDDEPAQADFKNEVGHYVNGRLWRSFTDAASCNQAVGEALKALSAERGPVPRSALPEPVIVPWLSEIQLSRAAVPVSGFVGHRNTFVPPSVSAPVLEFHAVGIGVSSAPSLREVEKRARQLARDMRNLGWVAEGDQLVIDAADGFGWAIRPPATSSSGSFPERKTVEQFRGALVHSTGVCAFQSLDTDMIGALVDQQGLQTDLASLLAAVSAHLPETESVTVATGLSRADRVSEGNPGLIGTRNSGRVAMSGPAELRAGGDFVVPTHRLTSSFGDLGADLAHAIIAQLRERL
ncbi:DUF4062 domain-containing protein [Mycolicibacterium pyrenivorans]|uniref:DUF4062 domain-containing protein n=1 Tax=Mycolicibacterium pyrenivorans TaxID=187102 RepID=UPI0021F2BD31|nr:DUF4062 domain-containing protein [Mycolicibacterium pyrenivorans]MCV7152411.1 DUF4062 domain-containing protein [Mycolicibacterium pyrenivorans]